ITCYDLYFPHFPLHLSGAVFQLSLCFYYTIFSGFWEEVAGSVLRNQVQDKKGSRNIKKCYPAYVTAGVFTGHSQQGK
ncbi:hypothetical protein, partial [Huintestinicola sp.]|uniref:hypothetical protein n=1 Tax=Huintestinicola sp. TaxID=2981661 RepID=UPI003D7C3D6B